jgi:hypothetical protein
MVPAPFDKEEKDGKVILRIHKDLRDIPFASYFGEIQRLSDPNLQQNLIRKAHIDFSECRWADPLALLHITLFLREFTSLSEDNTARVTLPAPDLAPRLLKFLAEEGFINILLDTPKIGVLWQSKAFTVDDIRACCALETTLAYCNCHALPAQLIDLSDNAFSLDDWLSRASSTIEANIIDTCPPWAREALVHKTRYFLTEALQNILEHAYEGWSTKQRLAAVYVRFRKGLSPNDPHRRSLIWEAASSEGESCRLNPDFLKDRAGCIEAFVLDAGIGLVESLRRAKQLVQGKYPFREACQAVFLSGLRRKEKQSGSEGGGLSILHDLLSRDRDFLRGCDSDSWVHGSVPYTQLGDSPESAGWRSLALGKDTCGHPIRGLSWTVRLSWITPLDSPEDGWEWHPGDVLSHPFLTGSVKRYGTDFYRKIAVLCNGNAGTLGAGGVIPVADWRFTCPPPRARKAFLDQSCSSTTQCVIVFPPRGLAKNDVIRLVEDTCRVTEERGVTDFLLVFCDVPPEEGRMYLRTLDRAQFYTSLSHLDAVVMASSRLAIAVFSPVAGKKTLVLNEQRRNAFFNSSSAVGLIPGESYAGLIGFLVFWDSNLYWQRLREKSANNDWHPYVTDQIQWGAEKTIHGYFDFSQTFHDALCVELYRTALRRLQGAVKTRQLMPADPLVSSLLEEHNAMRGRVHVSHEDTLPVIMVGSVQVTGATQKSACQEGHTTHTVDGGVCFFNHQDSELDDKGCLLLWPRRARWMDENVGALAPNPNDSKESLSRIGRTPAVGRGGESFFKLPRSSAFDQTPIATYEKWQSLHPCIVKIGHWHYQSNHDLLSVGIWKNLDFDAMTGTGALQYVLVRMLSMLGVQPTKLTTNKGRHLAKFVRPVRTHVSALVYNSHPSTDYVIQQLIEVLPEEFVARLVGLRQLRNRRAGSSLLVSPFALDRIKILFKLQEKPEVLLFDDAEITGRNSANLEALLTAAGAAEVHTLTVLDRRRLPVSKPPGSRQSYWRFDVPVMGNDGLCPLCRALDKARAFSARLLGCDDVFRQWTKDWNPQSPLTHWGGHGLDPVAMKLNEPHRHYPTDPPSVKPIKLQTSVGLAIYLAEMHAMTFHDDLVLDVLKQELPNIDAATRIQVLATQLLLFGEEFGKELKEQLMLALIEAALLYEPGDYRIPDRHLSLASLVILSQHSICIEEMCPRINMVLDEWETRKAEHGPQGGFPLPVDLQVLFACLVAESPQSFENKGEIISRCRRMLQPHFDTIAHIYDILFQEVYDDEGYVHRRPLPVLTRVAGEAELTDHPAIVHMLEDGLLSAYRLAAVLEKVLPTSLRAPPSETAVASINMMHNLKEELDTCIQKLKVALADGHLTWELFRPLKSAIENLLGGLRRLIELAYKDIDVKAINDGRISPLERDLEIIAQDLIDTRNWPLILNKRKKSRVFEGNKPVIKRSPSGRPFEKPPNSVWVLWDALTTNIVQHLMTNVIHSNEGTDDPWGRGEGHADMWLMSIYRETHTIITFVNSVKQSVLDKTHEATLPTAAEDLGIKVCYRQEGHLWYAHLALPRAGRLTEFRRFNPFTNLSEMEVSNG